MHASEFIKCKEPQLEFSFKKSRKHNLSASRGATDTSVLGLGFSALGFKARVDPLLTCFVKCIHSNVQETVKMSAGLTPELKLRSQSDTGDETR